MKKGLLGNPHTGSKRSDESPDNQWLHDLPLALQLSATNRGGENPPGVRGLFTGLA
jgi:hypothetical protein